MATVLTKLACAVAAISVAGVALAQSVGDRISVGALTHSAPSLDLALDFE